VTKTINLNRLKNDYIKRYALDDYFCSELKSCMTLKQLQANEHLLVQGDQLTHLYLLVSGKLEVMFYQACGHNAVFSIEQAFSIIGDLELFQAQGQQLIGTVKAITQAHILEIPVNKIRQYAMADPAFLRLICQQLSHKLYVSCQLHGNVAFKAVFQVRQYLASRSELEGQIIQLDKRDTIASLLGLSVRQLNRALKELADQELISIKNKTVVITDIERLKSTISTGY